MRALLLTIGLIAAAHPVVAQPTPAAARNGDHPAIAARRVIAAQGYDYASKFYPHPAWLYLSMQAPDDPAVVVSRPAEQERRAALRAGAGAPAAR
jgi:hypothetical protein